MTTSRLLSQVHVTLPDNKSYDILIGSHLLTDVKYLSPYCKGREVLIVTNPTVAQYHLNSLLQGLGNICSKLNVVEVIDSEEAKTSPYLEQIYTSLLEHNYSRRSLIIALGGGVIGDLAGYAAATYQRGIDFLQIPTTLLAQVDSSIGGKTAINHKLGKNMIGAFHQPVNVLIDLEVLKTLPDRELSAGLAEVIKYGFIFSAEFIEYLEHNLDRLRDKDLATLAQTIARCCEFKAKVVAEDEKETGVRALLNLGHTYGHAIEACQGYGNWLHGEAISTGMVLAGLTTLEIIQQNHATDIALNFTHGDLERVKQLLTRAGLPIHIPENMDSDSFLKYMARDKKNLANQIVLVLFAHLGQAYVEKYVSHDTIRKIINTYKGYAS
ncbi:3-dehydroquinate synthase [Psittacicella gerlachiana]|uniref:3-dehydroquinate synthase n=1 Tax=Psittacicella gerlachiana TaxID=2028574 RepID=A0A3A1YK07_9GAMM|nr:3-dehydroquinate synthase [Psittacicella gerlachiana]RIY37921.1 3-dehydroquinate synthase [Psittacicella gerlachiana]